MKAPPVSANDNIKPRTIEPFHRLSTSRFLHRSPVVRAQLYSAGERYRKSYFDAGGSTLSPPPVYKGPPASVYDEWKQVSRTPIDKARPYFDAAKELDALELRELVEAIVVHAEKLEEVGKQHIGRNQTKQAVAAAITALGIGLKALRNHYDSAAIERAA